MVIFFVCRYSYISMGEALPVRSKTFAPMSFFDILSPMPILNRKEALILAVGDVLLFIVALWLTLVLRYGAFPDEVIFYAHLAPFSLLFVVWLFVFFIAGLYEKHTLLLQSKLAKTLVKAEVVNSLIAVLFFYFLPNFGIAPKANLFICLILSTVFIFFWRLYGQRLFGKRRKQSAVIIGTGRELKELESEINNNHRYGICFLASIEINDLVGANLASDIISKINSENVTLVAIDLQNNRIEPLLPELYKLVFNSVKFVDIHDLYEAVFDRIPLSLVKYSWFLKNISTSVEGGFDSLKRFMDVFLSLVFGIISLVFYPFIILAIKLDDGGSVFIFQQRVGEGGKKIKVVKFRTMTRDDKGIEKDKKTNRPTRVGPFLRKSRLDELPQFLNVFMGDLSLVGPRPELPSLVEVYEREVPYYGIRHLVKPGLFGWAQLYHENHPHHDADVLETSVKLSYDLYYLKNRSLFLDLKIALKTMKVILSRSGA